MSNYFRVNSWPLGLVVVTALLAASGCSGTQSSGQALNNALGQAGMAKEPVFPFAGKVAIDGQPPKLERKQTLVVMLNDPNKLDAPSLRKKYVTTDEQGNFSFMTYTPNDGIKPGKYILTFAILTDARKFGLAGPDKLNNLYNDPDKNKSIPEFAIDHQAPGKSDYSFNLAVAGKESGEAGPHALTTLIDEGIPGASRPNKR
jgi:hypothetical protein